MYSTKCNTEMFDGKVKAGTPQPNYMLSNNSSCLTEQNFRSPVIPLVQPPQTFEISKEFSSTVHTDSNQQRIHKTHWICDYSDDIFQTLRDAELNRRLVCFRSQQIYHRPMLLKLLKVASEAHKLSRTTLHLENLCYIYFKAVYLLDCFMDNYTIRADKLNLCAITCLIIAAKIEEADVDMPKFGDLNKLLNDVYTLNEFKNIECKVLGTFNFDLIRPTAATFAEYFSDSIITLQDYYIFINHWNNEIILNNYHREQQELQAEINSNEEVLTMASYATLSTPCPYTTYEDMLTTLIQTFLDIIDISLNYLKFINVRPSIIASACIAAVRQMHGIFPTWTPYLIKLTCCTADMLSPFVEAVLAVFRIYYNNNINNLQLQPTTPVSPAAESTILCDSPDSGIVSGHDTKSTISDTDNEDNCGVELMSDVNNKAPLEDVDSGEYEIYHCLEYPRQTKRRRII